MRLFVAAWPSPEVSATLEAMPRPDHPTMRWTTAEQWHVTLRFLGGVDDEHGAAVADAVRSAAGAIEPCQAVLGPATARLGRGTLMVPVSGLDHVAAAVSDATERLVPRGDDHAFAGHLTVARGRGRRAVPADLAGQQVEGSWTVREVAIVQSHLDAQGARYETLATAPLGSGEPPLGST